MTNAENGPWLFVNDNPSASFQHNEVLNACQRISSVASAVHSMSKSIPGMEISQDRFTTSVTHPTHKGLFEQIF